MHAIGGLGHAIQNQLHPPVLFWVFVALSKELCNYLFVLTLGTKLRSKEYSIYRCWRAASSRFLVQRDDEDDTLLQGINSYRASLNLTALPHNDNAECLADEIADKFKNQPCTNTTGSNTVPGTEPQFSDYPNLLAKCHLNFSNTQDGAIMPACVPNLEPNLVLSNFTKSQYSGNLNDTKYTGAGIGSEKNWIVVVLTTNTSTGSFVPSTNAASLVSRVI
ncbi:uncharacterized GPI-anchored protein At5g19250-like [Juglans microcarpa x Juglans regia]|uniref:uncharacterized GPI-anchored protein At5g19250-like n=1 Tax=Juglans microcarpa x Juglans regia TaxID=2249226 RepID=UPI001B7F421E|nr:uncharacterized GPI-anchored protein At5g19250-like [Juglans microcarpa x Juglans regia]